MKPIHLFLGLIVILLIMIIIDNIKKKAYKKGYKDGELAVTRNILDISFWFGAKPIYYNTLYLFAMRYRKYQHVRADSFREDIYKIDHTERITEMDKEDLENLI